MLWEVDIHPADGQVDRAAVRLAAAAADLGLGQGLRLITCQGYLVQGDLDQAAADRLGQELLCDLLVEQFRVGPVGAAELCQLPSGLAHLVHVLPKPGVMDPVAQSTLSAIRELGLEAQAVRTFRKYWLEALSPERLARVCGKLLANDAIEMVVHGPLTLTRLDPGQSSPFARRTVPLIELDDRGLEHLSRTGQLYLKLPEMRAIQDHFRQLGCEPTDAELETLAQTWSEHCSHKTLTGRVHYRQGGQERQFQNLLKETIFAATQQIRRTLGTDDWCVSVFQDNAGVVRFDDDFHVVFKVETHNHPSALEPYGGANTGLGGVIRDPLGTGLGARPVCNTDVFCFAPPDTAPADLPPGVLHPRRVMQGVVSGVRDYGNRMGIPTVNGAIYFDPRYAGNPLVYCGTVGLLPCDKVDKAPNPGDYIVAVGGRTGRDGIHGATFSSAELTSESETLSGGAVQIGNAITEKMLLDVILVARDRDLYNAITDCGAGGFSSAVGEMGADLGAEVWLERAPLKYEGLSYTEIWISEAQERMVLAVPPETWDEFHEVCAAEGVEASIIGSFQPTGRLQLFYEGELVADLSMKFLHEGRPATVREATYEPAPEKPLSLPQQVAGGGMRGEGRGVRAEGLFSLPQPSAEPRASLLAILGSLNVASKEWVIRQYDHEVQGGSVLKPLVGVANDGPGDAAVLRPILSSRRGLVVACGMNPHFGDLDTAAMAESALDEALRNCVAVGADPRRIAILDNFCWGDTDRPETLGSLVRAALACHDLAVALGTPFISGKDSLNNEYRYTAANGERHSLAIPPSLLISALGQVADVSRCVSMDLKQPGNLLYQVGRTHDELGGSHYALVHGLSGGRAPRVNAEMARKTFLALHTAIDAGLVRACHDLSEGGLAVALAEMAFAGGWGASVSLEALEPVRGPTGNIPREIVALFSESNTRFLCEVAPAAAADFERACAGIPWARIGEVDRSGFLEFRGTGAEGQRDTATSEEHEIRGSEVRGEASEPSMLKASLSELKEAWQRPLRW